MSSTRHAPAGAPLRQEKFKSSPAYRPGLLAHLVADRCAHLESNEARAIVWWLQQLSWRDSRAEGIAEELLSKYADRLGTEAMRALGLTRADVCNAQTVMELRASLRGVREEKFALRGECTELEKFELSDPSICSAADRAKISPVSAARPESIPAEAFFAVCEAAAREDLARHLSQLCLDPETDAACGPWYFAELPHVLQEFKALCQAEARKGVAITTAGKMVAEAIEETSENRCFTMVFGEPGRGKTTSAKAYCNASAGACRYFLTPPTNDDHSFLLGLAKTLGVSSNLKSRNFELYERIEQTLVGGDITLVIDEAARLWPASNIRDNMPSRILWLIQMADRGVPIVLIVTPHFFETKERIEKATGWNTEQLTRRFRRIVDIPTQIPREDLEAVCEALLPSAAEEIRAMIVESVFDTAEPLDTLDAIAKRALSMVAGAGREPGPIEIARSADIVDRERKVLDRLAPLKDATGKPVRRSNTEDTAATSVAEKPKRAGARRPGREAFAPSPRHEREPVAAENLSRREITPTPAREVAPITALTQ